jgi:hypothetical protein
MSEEDKNGAGEKESKEGFGSISRRNFLKDAGFVVGVPAIGTMITPAEAAEAQPTHFRDSKIPSNRHP